jgi:hypothetical protein
LCAWVSLMPLRASANLLSVVPHTLVGAVIATVVAQAAGYFGTIDSRNTPGTAYDDEASFTFSGGTAVDWCLKSGLGRQELRWVPNTEQAASKAPTTWPLSVMAVRTKVERRPPWWSRIRDERGAKLAVDESLHWGDPQQYDYAVGWPVVSFRFEYVTPKYAAGQSGPPRVAKGAAHEFWMSPTALLTRQSIQPRFITFNPIWSGLIASSLFWSVVSWGTWTIARTEVRRRRVARGQCPMCGYSVSGLLKGMPCPECGSDIPSKRTNDRI